MSKKITSILVVSVILFGLISWFVYQYKQIENQINTSLLQSQETRQKLDVASSTQQAPSISSTTVTKMSAVDNVKIYTNTEYGFKFQYPENWKIIENPYSGPFSKFNLIIVPTKEKYLSDPILINVVTIDFANNAAASRKNLGAIISNIIVGGVDGKKYEYTEEFPTISIDIPFKEYRIIIGAKKKYETIFNQIISTFKFTNR